MTTADGPPPWLRRVADAATGAWADHAGRWSAPDDTARESAVLLLFGDTDGRSDVLLIERAAGLRSHAGQAAFPGGGAEPGDAGPVGTALRECAEETGVDPAGVEVITTLPPLWISVSNYSVTPVLAWWREPCEVRVADPVEVASVQRVPVSELTDPAHRLQLRYPSGQSGPAFRAGGMLIWGFTAGVLSALFDAAGLAEPWDRTLVEPLPTVMGLSREGRGGS
ncbi:NUDIX hydrolase [Jiangella alba]|uniref:8-oxo-dGTP pyrophosphatase MutT, NUDIX family n=1 Tax=Jiangella alba TaxID=561176 RepID=A0A1H5PH62_9ACTN|nr:CoA pyrophosphatase [Jiangella alba]SEF13110.1 8-oxo-dGTP pyrophosphatase MutT, NUDIX family [Jiangella alba]